MSNSRTGYTRSPFLQNGALIQLNNDIVGIIPFITLFQYNPETIRHSFAIEGPFQTDDEGKTRFAALDLPTSREFPPRETFGFTLELDATDDLEIRRPLTIAVGVADRLAALERLIFPTQGLIADISNLLGEPTRSTVPIVLLALGTSRVLPVWVSSLSITEKAHNTSLLPTHADVEIEFQVITPQDLSGLGLLDLDVLLAHATYRINRAQRNYLAVASTESAMTDQLHDLGLI